VEGGDFVSIPVVRVRGVLFLKQDILEQRKSIHLKRRFGATDTEIREAFEMFGMHAEQYFLTGCRQ
jgi:hypothetical protein